MSTAQRDHQAAQALLQRFLRLTGYFPLTSVGLLAATLTFSTMASEIKQADIKFTGRAYQYHFTLELQAPIEVVRDIVTDYDNLARINDDIVQSEILERYGERQLKRRMWLNHCVLVFCFDLYFVENVEELDDGTITTTVIAAESNFRRGYSKRYPQLLDFAFILPVLLSIGWVYLTNVYFIAVTGKRMIFANVPQQQVFPMLRLIQVLCFTTTVLLLAWKKPN